MPEDDLLSEWMQRRRALNVPDGFADRVMEAVDKRDLSPERQWLISFLIATGASRVRRYAICMGALLIGMIPYVYVAYVVQILVF